MSIVVKENVAFSSLLFAQLIQFGFVHKGAIIFDELNSDIYITIINFKPSLF